MFKVAGNLKITRSIHSYEEVENGIQNFKLKFVEDDGRQKDTT